MQDKKYLEINSDNQVTYYFDLSDIDRLKIYGDIVKVRHGGEWQEIEKVTNIDSITKTMRTIMS